MYLTTQLTELGIPVVIAVNMMDVVRKNGDNINIPALADKLGCKIVEISALKGEGVDAAAQAAVEAAKNGKTVPMHTFSGSVEHAIAHIEAAEKELDDDAESIITNERYLYIADLLKGIYKKKGAHELSTSDKIDRIVTNRWLGLPIFAVVMFAIYYISMVTVGASATDWANDGLFGDGFHLFGMGTAEPSVSYTVEDEETIEQSEITVYFDAVPADAGDDVNAMSYRDAVAYFEANGFEEPDPADYGIWVPGVPAIIEGMLDAVGCADWLKGLIPLAARSRDRAISSALCLRSRSSRRSCGCCSARTGRRPS